MGTGDEIPSGDSPPAPSLLPITTDLPCMHCGYNLRTRTVADRCPECGAPIGQTLAHLQQSAGVLLEARALHLSALLFAALSIVAVPVYASQLFLESPLAAPLPPFFFFTVNPIAMTVVHVLFLGALLIATLLFCAGFSQRILSPGVRSLATLVTMIYAIMSGPLGLARFSRLMRFRFVPFLGFRAAAAFVQYRISVAFLSLFLLYVGFICFRRLADALASEPLRRRTLVVFSLMFGQALFPLAIFGLMGTYNFRWGWSLPNTRLLIAPDFFSACSCAVFAWFWLGAARIFRSRPSTPSSALPPPPPAPPAGDKVLDFLKHRP